MTSWALITGATDGIGQEYALELAARGFNIIVHGRNPDKIKKVRDQVENETGRKTIPFQADLSQLFTNSDYQKLVDAQIPEEFDIALLVNNAGLNFKGLFEEISGKQV